MGGSPLGTGILGQPGAPGQGRDPYADLAGILMVMLQALSQGQGAGPQMGQNPGMLDPTGGLDPTQGLGGVPGAGSPFGPMANANSFTDPSGLNSAMNFNPGLGSFVGGQPDLGSWIDGFSAGMNAAQNGGLGCQDPLCAGTDPWATAGGDSSGNDPFASALAQAGSGDGLGTSDTGEGQQPPVVNNFVTNNNTQQAPPKQEDGTPVILDVNGDGQVDTGGKGGPKINFDLNGDGKKDQTEWMKPGSQDGLLVSDFNQDGQINDGSELMRKTGENGEQNKYQNGWDKVSKLFDRNRDGQVNGQELNGLKMWQDGNANGQTDPGELKNLRQLGISSIDVPQNGQMDSTFTRNGQQQLARDYNFEVGRWG